MPLQRRLPKVGFSSRVGRTTAQIRLDDLKKVTADTIDLLALKSAGLVPENTLRVKVINSGEVKSAVNLKGIVATAGAKSAIEAAGGKVEE